MALTFAASQVACAACNVMYDPIEAAKSDKDEIPCAYYPARHIPAMPDPHAHTEPQRRSASCRCVCAMMDVSQERMN